MSDNEDVYKEQLLKIMKGGPCLPNQFCYSCIFESICVCRLCREGCKNSGSTNCDELRGQAVKEFIKRYGKENLMEALL